jgi:hypothetical protein
VWRLEGITLREERPWLMRRLGDVDEEALRTSLLRMIAIHERYPEITTTSARTMSNPPNNLHAAVACSAREPSK